MTVGYWAVPMRRGDEYKTGVVTPHGPYAYLRMGMGLKDASQTYTQFGDLTFGHLPPTDDQAEQPTLLKDHDKARFSTFADDHVGAATSFESMFTFLHTKYFPQCAFGPVYLVPQKTFIFVSKLDFMGFTGSADSLWPSMRHRDQIRHWPMPTNREEVEGFLWLTPFLRVFIPGRAEHALVLKKAYIEEVPIKLSAGSKTTSVRTKLVKTGQFVWEPTQQRSFNYIKNAIFDNVMGGADPAIQYHLATDASKFCARGVLFQLTDEPSGTKAANQHKAVLLIIMFMSFGFESVETRYTTTEREALAVVRCLAEVRWLVMGSPYPTKIYTDHRTLESIFKNGTNAHGRLAR